MFVEVADLLFIGIKNVQKQLVNNSVNIIGASITFIIAILISRILKETFYKLTGKIIRKKSLRRFITSFFQALTITLGFLISLSILNLGKVVTSMLAGAGAAGLVVGFAVREIIANYLSGITIAIGEPFAVGDFVRIGNTTGIVEKIKIRTTELIVPEGQLVEIPNKDIINSPIINYTATGQRRIEVKSGISYESDPEKAKNIGLEVVSKIKGVNKEMPIEFFYDEFGNSALNFVLRAWMDFENSQTDFFKLKSKIITELLKAYDRENITMPYPTTTVRLEKED